MAAGKFLNRDQILAATFLPKREVSAYGGVVLLWGLSGTERDAFEAATLKGKGKNIQANLENFRARLVAECARDEHGNKLFSPADVAALGKTSAAELAKLYDAAAELSGISEADVDELTKNFVSDQSEDSGSS
ncbi:hypothetical protein FBQ81_03205 [Chloroflexi bacterium CFX6]|nr:hypothetical protein [Chloroflexi bacterium CFX6]